MKLYQSRVINNFVNFQRKNGGYMRELVDSFLLWKTIEYFQPKRLLEIGCYAGQSLGLMIEAAGPDAVLESVDITYEHRQPFDSLFPDNNVIWKEIDSYLMTLTGQYDFIHIDGDHSYKYALNDIQKCLPTLSKSSILLVDDYSLPGVDLAIQETLLGQHDFVPFLKGDQQVLFHHKGHQADDFLDYRIQEGAKNFIYFNNIDYKGFVVLEAKLPNIFVENRAMFVEACKFYNL